MEITKADIFRELVNERDRVRAQYNDSIMKMITPITLTALFELFELESKCVEWNAVDVVDDNIVLVVKLTYTADENTPDFLKLMDRLAKASPNALVRTLRIGIPVAMAFTSKEQVKEYLVTSAQKVLSPPKHEEVDFDPAALSKEQIEQLKLYQTMQKVGDK